MVARPTPEKKTACHNLDLNHRSLACWASIVRVPMPIDVHIGRFLWDPIIIILPLAHARGVTVMSTCRQILLLYLVA